MTIELAIALSDVATYQPHNYVYAPGMTSQVLLMKADLQRELDADVRTVLAYVNKQEIENEMENAS